MLGIMLAHIIMKVEADIYVQLIDVEGVDCDLEGAESKTCDLCLHLYDDSISASCVAI